MSKAHFKTSGFMAKKTMGWREWVGLPDLGVHHIKVKVDTGARTSALHAEDIEVFTYKGQKRVRFTVYPEQGSRRRKSVCEADLLEKRKVRSSVGHETDRPVIVTTLRVGVETWPIELTLVNRDIMGFRMLLRRTAIRHGFLVDPARSFLCVKK